MNGEQSGKLSIIWSAEARSDLRQIDRSTALDILHCTGRFLATRSGDVKQLKPPQAGFRLRCADYRIFFEFRDAAEIVILAVRNRREAYR